MKKLYLLLMFIACTAFALRGEVVNTKAVYKATTCRTAVKQNLHPLFISFSSAGDTLLHRKHRLIAAILAFPIPFGIFGLHRVYLGTSTGVPFFYIATLGGAFGILPFVDFILILLCKNVNTYAHNPAVFMWTRKKH